MAEPIITNINPIKFSYQEISNNDTSLIKNFDIYSNFGNPNTYSEFHIYNNEILIFSDLNYTHYSVINNPSQAGTTNDSISSISEISVDVVKDLENVGISEGIIETVYTFFNKKFGSSTSDKFFIKEISSDRTELKLYSNTILSDTITTDYNNYASFKANNPYFTDYKLNFGDNNLIIAVNFLTQVENNNLVLLVKLYEPLPLQFDIKSELWIVEEAANPIGFNVEFPPEIIEVDDSIYIQGPNLNIDILDQISNSTTFQNYNSLTSTTNTSSLNQLKSLLEDQSIQINIDYEDYSNFIKFSSAYQRLYNFYLKVKNIENYNNDINQITSNITGSSSSSYHISSSITILQNNITNIIENFDGYEYFLYYESSSYSWPKNNFNPVTLYSTGSAQTLTWYNNQTSSAILYDNQNKDYLVYTIPEYLRTDEDNTPYLEFVDMVGQHYDNIFIYLKSITDKLVADNRLTSGIAQDLTSDVLKSLGLEIYQNNFTTNDLFASYLGVTPSLNTQFTGSELITTYITASISGSLSSSLVPIATLNNSIYKRLYNNLPYLLKKKGTVDGIKTLLNIYGIPDTLIRINEYGGKDDINVNDYDYYFERYSNAFKTYQQAQPIIPWLPLYRNLLAEGNFNVPDEILFRFKTNGIPSSSNYQQYLLVKTSNENSSKFDFGIQLNYTGSSLVSGSYSGSVATSSKYYGDLKLLISGAFGYVTSSNINLPFFDGDWWSVSLYKNTHTSESIINNDYVLRTANKIYNGPDGFTIGYTGSTSLSITGSTSSSYNTSWNIYKPFTSSYVPYGALLGGFSSSIFSGSFQEFRYHSHKINSSTFYDYTMNPNSIEGINIIGSLSYFDIVNFRAPLGNELEAEFSSSLTSLNSSSYNSHHPAYSGSFPTSSFILGGSLYGFGIYGGNTYGGPLTSSNNYNVVYYSSSIRYNNSVDNIEYYYQDQPIIGIQNPNSNKIQIVSSSNYGNVLSLQQSIQQQYFISSFNSASGNYTKDINYVEIAFSPQNEINDDIANSYGYFNIGEFIGDPRYYSSSRTDYTSLNNLRDDYFKKYIDSYNWNAYIRLIKYYDNSLFKLIKDFTPVRSGLATGLVIKQHYLERNRVRPAQVEYNFNDYSCSIDMVETSGSTAGTFEEFNRINPFINNFIPDFTQSWYEIIDSPLGLISESRNTQVEFYNGEFSGSQLIVSDGNLNEENPFLFIDTTINNYEITLYRESYTSNNNFLNPLTSPNSGELYLYYDNGGTRRSR